jgi:chemotaxis protein methyltransferase CheR
VRQALNWQQGNILAVAPGDEAAWDVILCRNVAIYLEAAAAARLWSRLSQALDVGGILVAGKAERPDHQAGLVRWAPCVFEKGK